MFLADILDGDLSWIYNPWLALVAIIIISFTLGLWVDTILKKRPTKAEKSKKASTSISHMQHLIEKALEQERASSYFDSSIPRKIEAFYIKLKKLGLDVPDITFKQGDEKEYLQLHWSYLNNIVHLLEGGHWEEAKDAASNTVISLHQLIESGEKITERQGDDHT